MDRRRSLMGVSESGSEPVVYELIMWNEYEELAKRLVEKYGITGEIPDYIQIDEKIILSGFPENYGLNGEVIGITNNGRWLCFYTYESRYNTGYLAHIAYAGGVYTLAQYWWDD